MKRELLVTTLALLIGAATGMTLKVSEAQASPDEKAIAAHWVQVGQQQGVYCGAQAMRGPYACETDGECESAFIRDTQACLDTEIDNGF